MLPHSTWVPHTENNCHLCMRTKGERPKSVLNVEDIMSLDESKPIPLSIEKDVSHVILIKMKQSLLPNMSIKIDTGGSQNMTLTPITVARKESHSITSRTLRTRTKQTKDIMEMIAGIVVMQCQLKHLVNTLLKVLMLLLVKKY